MPQDNREIEDGPPTAPQDDIEEIRFHPDVEVEVPEDRVFQRKRGVFLLARATFTDHRGKEITVEITRANTTHSDFGCCVVYTQLPEEQGWREKSYESVHEPITKINRMAGGRHPEDDGGRARRWWESIYDLSL